MRRLMILAFTFVALCDVNCQTDHTTKSNVETNTYHPHQYYISNPAPVHHQGKDLFYHSKDPLSANQGQVSSLSSKQTPSTVLYRDDSAQGTLSNYPTLQHYQTIVPQRSVPDYNIQTVAGTSHVPLTTNGHGYLILSPINQHAGFYQPTNQYSATRSFVESSVRPPQLGTGPVQFYTSPAYSQFHLPAYHQNPAYNEHSIASFQKIVQHPNQQISQQTNPAPNIYKPVETSKPTSPVAPEFQLKTPLLYQHQVYHPLHTSVKNPQQQLIPRPHKLAPPTPPRIYKVFSPMIPKKIIPVTERPVPQRQPQHQTHDREADEEEENEDKAEVNEEEEDDEGENEKIEEDDDNHSNVKEEDDYFRPGYGFSGKYRGHDDEDDDDHHHSHYRHHDDDDHDSSDTKKYSKHIEPQSKLSSKYKYPKNFAGVKEYTRQSKYQVNPSFYQHKASPGPDFPKPKVEVKMYKYTRSSNEPQKTEYIEGKGSELKPVISHNQKTYQSKWIISTKTSSSSNN